MSIGEPRFLSLQVRREIAEEQRDYLHRLEGYDEAVRAHREHQRLVVEGQARILRAEGSAGRPGAGWTSGLGRFFSWLGLGPRPAAPSVGRSVGLTLAEQQYLRELKDFGPLRLKVSGMLVSTIEGKLDDTAEAVAELAESGAATPAVLHVDGARGDGAGVVDGVATEGAGGVGPVENVKRPRGRPRKGTNGVAVPPPAAR